MSNMQWIITAFLLTCLTYASSLEAGPVCASCSGLKEQLSCGHHITCNDYEECPHTLSAIVGKRAEGHHVMCEVCCNNGSMCNQVMSCESLQNQGSQYPRDCSELNLPERVNDSYTIYPFGVKERPVSVFCVFDYDNLAWTVIQRRLDGSVNFYRDWRDYKSGFGYTGGEYWLGLENIHALTSIPNHELKVLMTDFENVTRHATYASFHIDDASMYYHLSVYGYSGTAGDSMKPQNGMKFSTYDADHDTYSKNCAVVFHGGWWYSNCHSSNLNGKYLAGPHSSYADGVNWASFHGYHYSLKSTVMMIRKT